MEGSSRGLGRGNRGRGRVPGNVGPQAIRGSIVGQTGTRPRPRWATGGREAIQGSRSPPYEPDSITGFVSQGLATDPATPRGTALTSVGYASCEARASRAPFAR